MDKVAAFNLLKLQCAAARNPVLSDEEVRAILESHARFTTWQPGATYVPGDTVLPTVRNGHTYQAIVNQQYGALGAPGISGATEPIWPLYTNPDSRTGLTRPYWDGYSGGGRNYAVAMVADGGVIWIEAGPDTNTAYNLAAATYAAWQIKAGRASELFTYSLGQQKVEAEQVFTHCTKMARQYAPTGVY